MTQPIHLPKSQRGAALIMALVFLVILTILGVTAMSGASLEEKMAGNLKEQTVAFEAAETAVTSGEGVLAALTEMPKILPGSVATTIYDGEAGWYDVKTGAIEWKTHSWSASTGSANYSGLTNVYTQPKYIIEETALIENGSLRVPTDYIANRPTGKVFYRITGRGTGGTDAAQAIVQSVYARQFN